MIEVKNVTYTFSGMIEFKEISKASYDRLLQFVTALNNNKDYEEPIGPSKSIEKQEGVDNKVGKEEEPSRPPEASKKASKKDKSGIDVPHTVEKLRNVIEYANLHPQEYEYRLCLAREFLNENKEEFEGVSIITLGKAAEELKLERKLVSTNEYGSPRRMRLYPMKRKENVEEDEKKSNKVERIVHDEKVVTPKKEIKADSFGEFLKKMRKQVGLSVYELSDMIQYPYYTIQAWENGSGTPSSEAISVLTNKFGKEFQRFVS